LLRGIALRWIARLLSIWPRRRLLSVWTWRWLLIASLRRSSVAAWGRSTIRGWRLAIALLRRIPIALLRGRVLARWRLLVLARLRGFCKRKEKVKLLADLHSDVVVVGQLQSKQRTAWVGWITLSGRGRAALRRIVGHSSRFAYLVLSWT
jgi:hypothetical protein